MKFCLLSGLIFFCSTSMGQSAEAIHLPHQFVYIPKAYTDSSSSLASYIQKNFKGQQQQINAAYRWVTSNIRYDKDSMLYINWGKENDQKIASTLRRKKGVCDNFASVFADILTRMQIPAYVVNGLTRQNGPAARTAHSWVAVKAENEWLLCDPTWDAGFHLEPRFYLNSPAEFSATHWPFDPMWQLNTHPISLKEFENGAGAGYGKPTFINPLDSIQNFFSLSSLQQLEATSRRMKAAEQQNEVIKNWQGYHNMNLAIIYEEQDMNLFNEAVASLNRANLHLNKFVTYRNNLFEPSKPDEQLKEMLEPVNPALAEAYKKMESIGRFKENYQYDTSELSQRLKNTEKKLQQQKDFLHRYLGTVSDQRKQVFY